MIETYYYKDYQIEYNSKSGNTKVKVLGWNQAIKTFYLKGNKGKKLAEEYIDNLSS